MKPLRKWMGGYGCTWLLVPLLSLSAGGMAFGGALVRVTDEGWQSWDALQLGVGMVCVALGGWQLRRTLWPLLQLMHEAQQRSPLDWRPLVPPKGASPALQALVQEANHRLALQRQQAQDQERFVADAAHQLRTPLAALQAQVEAWLMQAQRPMGTTKMGSPAGDVPQAIGLHLTPLQLQHIHQSTRRTTQLANQLLMLARIGASTHQRDHCERTDMHSMAADLLEQFWPQAEAKNIDLGLEVQASFVNGQPWQLREMWANLVDNALKYTPAGGCVTLRCGVLPGVEGEPRSMLQVEDNGPGLAPAQQGKVLQRFYRVPGSAGEGSGLGLPIAAEIAQAHGAVMHLEDGAGNKGLRVTVIFPVMHP